MIMSQAITIQPFRVSRGAVDTVTRGRAVAQAQRLADCDVARRGAHSSQVRSMACAVALLAKDSHDPRPSPEGSHWQAWTGQWRGAAGGGDNAVSRQEEEETSRQEEEEQEEETMLFRDQHGRHGQ